MFTRIKYAARVLSSPNKNQFEEPDIVFQEEKAPQVSAISTRIAGFLEVLVVSIFLTWVLALFHVVLPFEQTAKLNGPTATLVFIFVVIVQQIWGKLHSVIGTRLQIRDRIAPFFGRRLTRVVTTLRS
jgi:hypothetical protein